MPKEQQRRRGIITTMMRERNYGYLNPEDQKGVEVWFHSTACPDWETLLPGDSVTYLPMESAKGPRALKVTKS